MTDISSFRHSLRTPLNHIIGYSEMRREDASEQQPEIAGALDEIHEAAQELLQSIQKNLMPGHQRVEAEALQTLQREADGPIHRILGCTAQLIDEAGFAAPDMLRIRGAAGVLRGYLESARTAQLTSPEQSDDGPPQPAARLLVVDDDEGNRDILRRQLNRQGYSVEAAAGGAEALRRLAQTTFDLVLLDIVMPGMDGYQVLAEIKTDPRVGGVPVIVISALDEMQSVARCIEMGADDFVSKPFDRVILKARIGALLRRREAEREVTHLADRLRLLLESTSEGIFGLDREGHCTFINAAAVKMLGYSREELLGQSIHALVHYRRRNGSPFPESECPMNRAAREGAASRIGDDMLLDAEGRELPVEYSANPIVRDGQIEGAVIMFSDISERQRTEEKFRETAKLESLGVLAGGVAHDFNNLLTGILGNASLVLDSPDLAERDREKLEYVVTASERAADLTRQMLAYAGKGRYETRAVELSSLVRETADLMHTLLPKTVHIRTDLAADLPWIEADPSQLQQVIMNLVINAGEAIGEPHSGTVAVQTSECILTEADVAAFDRGEVAPGPCIMLEVSDTGCGMPPEVLARIFDPFFTTKFTGRGLGLAAVLGIIKSHRGTIQVQSAVGQGSRFRVYLPATAKAARPVPESPAPPPPAGKLRVLVVDDEEVVRATTKAVLERRGLEALVAESGEEGVRLLSQHKEEISAVLLDMMMPGMSGDEVFRRMREISSDVPIIVSSGYGESQVMQYFLGSDVSAFIQKPYTSSALIEKIGSVVARARSSVV